MTTQTLAFNSIQESLYWSNLDDLTMAQADRDAAKAQVAGVAAVQDRYDAAVVAINTDGNLSAPGGAYDLLAAGKHGLDQLTALTPPTQTNLDEQIVSPTRALRRAASLPDATVVTELRAIESRAAFNSMDDLLRPSAYLALCGNGMDDAAWIAVENAGGFAPLLTADVIEQGRKIRGARVLFGQATALDAAADLRARPLASVAAARKHISITVTGGDPMQATNTTAAELEG